MLYGENLTLPEKFFLDLDVPTDPACFVQYLWNHLQTVCPKPTAHYHEKKIFLFKDLVTCSHIFVRVNNTKRPLQPSYEGPYQVLARDDKISIKGQLTTIFIDRVKPAHFENDALPEPAASGQLQDAQDTSHDIAILSPSAPRVYSGSKTKKIVKFALLIRALGEWRRQLRYWSNPINAVLLNARYMHRTFSATFRTLEISNSIVFLHLSKEHAASTEAFSIWLHKYILTLWGIISGVISVPYTFFNSIYVCALS